MILPRLPPLIAAYLALSACAAPNAARSAETTPTQLPRANHAEHEGNAAGTCATLEPALADAESTADVAGAALAVGATDVRSTLERWLNENAPARSAALRSAGASLSADLQDIVTTGAAPLDAIARHVRDGTPYDEDARQLQNVIAQMRVACPNPLVPPQRPGRLPLPSARLTPESIQVVVRAHFARLQRCYDDGLLENPRLRGKVTTTFIIDSEGDVASIANTTDLSDATVVTCIQNGFRDMRFAKPRGGMVTVVYPIQFSPADAERTTPAGPVSNPIGQRPSGSKGQPGETP